MAPFDKLSPRGPIEKLSPRSARSTQAAYLEWQQQKQSPQLSQYERSQKAPLQPPDLAEGFAAHGPPRPTSSPGAGLGSILGNTQRPPSRTRTSTGSAYMSGEQDVKLYMYDLSNGMAKTLSPMLGSWLSSEELDGVWHSGVVVFGQEYFFNGDLVHVSPGETMWGSPTKVVTIGHTTCSRNSLHQFVVDKLRPQFNRSSYDALNNNCNHFADRICMFLCQRHIPDRILQQPDKLAKLPALRLLRPFFDQWLGSGNTAVVCDEVLSVSFEEGLESAATENEPHLSIPSRRRTVRRDDGSIVRATSRSLEPGQSGQARRGFDLERSRTEAHLGPVSSPAASPRLPRRDIAGEPSRGGYSRSSVEDYEDNRTPSKQSLWPAGDTARSRLSRDCYTGRRGASLGRDVSSPVIV